jgi:hypothetical protein
MRSGRRKRRVSSLLLPRQALSNRGVVRRTHLKLLERKRDDGRALDVVLVEILNVNGELGAERSGGEGVW